MQGLKIDTAKKLIQKGLRAVGVRRMPPLTPQLAGLERVFRSPPFTQEMVAALRLIAPQFKLSTDERSRLYWEADQNGASWGEYNALSPLFRSMKQPTKILEIGPGLGRSIVFFSRKLGWEDSEIHAFEGDGDSTRYTVLGPRFEDSFCGNISLLRSVLDYNGIRNVTIQNARDIRISDLPGPYDFLYSFYSIGYHWSIEHFLEDLTRLMHDDSVAVFTVPSEFKPFPKLEEMSYRVLDWKTVWPKDGRLKLLVLAKHRLPQW